MNPITLLSLVGIGVGLLADGLVNRKSRGSISYPRNGDKVSRLFRTEGTLESLPADQHLLLVVEIGGLKWPKGKVQVNNSSWNADVYEGGTPPNGVFSLSLYAVSSEGYLEIAAWLERGRVTGDYPGLSHIKNGIRLDRVKLRLES